MREVDEAYRRDSRRVLATLVRWLGDFDLAEEGLSEAFAAALERWPVEGVPENPRAWLVSTGRFRAIDAIRRRARFDAIARTLADRLDMGVADPARIEGGIEDDRLRLIFLCCHPDLAIEQQVALTLREVCGLATEEIASAFLVPAPTLAQRIVRAKARIREAGLVPELPSGEALRDRLDAVLRVVYLVFNEGYRASRGAYVLRTDLTGEAILLVRLLTTLLPDPEVSGLLALMTLHEARKAGRTRADGSPVLLEDQDRSTWDRGAIDEGRRLVEAALGSGRFGAYTLQAAIALLHAEAPSVEATDWSQILGFYDALWALEPSPVVALNRAVALAMRDGPASGLAGIERLLAGGDLTGYPPAYLAKADMLRRLSRWREARAAYREALDLTAMEPERAFLSARIREMEAAGGGEDGTGSEPGCVPGTGPGGGLPSKGRS